MNYLKCDRLCLRAEAFKGSPNLCMSAGCALHDPIHYWVTKSGRAQVSPYFPSEECQHDATSCAYTAIPV